MEKDMSAVSMRGITKSFFGVHALQNVDFEFNAGEVMALVGENGAGKSTLMKILAGAQKVDSGEIIINGESVVLNSPREAKNLGVSVIYQELELAEHLNIAENIFVGQKIKNRLGFVDFKRMHERSREILNELHIDLDTHEEVRNISIAKKQMVEIARAVSANANIIIMDEPTSSLPSISTTVQADDEVEILMKLLDQLRNRGIAIVYISHRMDEVFRISDRITILRDGRLVGVKRTDETTQDEIVSMMVGRNIEEFYGKGNAAHTGETVFEVSGIAQAKNNKKEISINVKRGEIVGIAGLVGAGRTELALSVFGINPSASLKIKIHNQPVSIKNPREAIKKGLGYVPEDRKLQGLFLGMAVRPNISAVVTRNIAKYGFINRSNDLELSDNYIKRFNIKTNNMEKVVGQLSGGNQQKVVIAKWMAAHPDILILDEPTRGVDVGAKAEIYSLMYDMAKQGMALIMISSEQPEILAVSDRIYVMREGHMAGTLDRNNANEENIMAMATGTYGGDN